MSQPRSSLPKMRKYYFICKNIPAESFDKDIPRDKMDKNIGWLCELMKEQYEMKQDKYLVDGQIESIFDNLGFVDMYQSLQDVYLTRIFYFSVSLASEGIAVRYCTILNNKNTEDIVKLPSGVPSTILQLKQAIAQKLQAEVDRLILRYHGIQLLDDLMTLEQVGIKGGKESKNFFRVVLLKSVFLMDKEGNREKTMLEPYYNLQMQISKLIGKPEKEFVVVNDEGNILDNIEKIKQNETIKVRDCLNGDLTIDILLKSDDDIEEEEAESSLKLKVMKSDSIEFIIGLFKHFHEIPYIISIADTNMKLIKQTTKISELLLDQEIVEKEQPLRLLGICKYKGEVTIVSKQQDNIVLSLNFKERVVDLKRILENKIGIDQLDQLLYYKGSVLEDSKQLCDYCICSGSKISVEENIFKESRILSNKQSFVYQNASQATSTSRSLDLLYKLKNYPDRNADDDNNNNDSEIFGQGLNILYCCTSNFCKQSFSDAEMLCLRGLGAHLVSVLDNGVLENINCMRCLSPVMFKGFVMKDCSVIYIEQTNEGIRHNFTWNSFGVLNIEHFKVCSSNWRAIYFSITEQLKSHKNSEMTNCLICRKDFLNDGQQTHKECLEKFPFDFHSVFELLE